MEISLSKTHFFISIFIFILDEQTLYIEQTRHNFLRIESLQKMVLKNRNFDLLASRSNVF